MAEVCVIKSFRATPELEYKIKSLKELSGLSESEIIRTALSDIKIIKEKPSKELMLSLSKLNNIGNNINQLTKYANTYGEIDWDSLTVCISNLNSVVNEIRKKYL